MGKGSGRGGYSESHGLRGGHAVIANERPAQLSISLNNQECNHVDEGQHWPKGLQNVGNTCYANAALQCLLSTALTHALLDPKSAAIFRRYSSNPNLLEQGSGSVDSDDTVSTPVRELTHREKRRNDLNDRRMQENCQWLTTELKTITREYHGSPPNQPGLSEWFMPRSVHVVNPASITSHPDRLSNCLRPYQQEDAHEFLRALLGTLVMNGQNRQLSSLFDGLLESAVTCLTCRRPSLTRDRYMDLSLDIASSHIDTLHDALAEFTKTETLYGDNQVYCGHCDAKRDATKGLRLATAPSILVCHLKRFGFDQYGRLNRLDKKVKFPSCLEIGDFMSRVNRSRPPPYDLVAVLVHQGRSCDSGHYLSYVKSNGDWFRCNDSEVTKVDVETVLSQQAYILMYEVAEMRENHGYPSPNKSCGKASWREEHYGPQSKRSLGYADLTLSSLMCGLDDSLRDICYHMGSCENVCHESRRSHTTDLSNYHSRTDLGLEELSTLGEATVDTETSFRRSTSSNNLLLTMENMHKHDAAQSTEPSRTRRNSFANSDPGQLEGETEFKDTIVPSNWIAERTARPDVLPPLAKNRHRRSISSDGRRANKIKLQ